MRHRIGGAHTGLGNSAPAQLQNNWSGDKSFDKHLKNLFSEAIKTFPLMKQSQGCDFQLEKDRISFGIEPAYQHDELEIVIININKTLSYHQRGHAWGAYGSQIVTTTKSYNDYIYKSKFIRFIDKWHELLAQQSLLSN